MIQVAGTGEHFVSVIAMKAVMDIYTQKEESRTRVITVAKRIGDTLNLELQYKEIFEDELIPEGIKCYGKKLLRDPLALSLIHI